MWTSRNSLREDTNMEAFLFTVARNTIITTFRKKILEKEYLEHLRFLVVKNPADTEKQVDYNLLSEQVQQLVNKLPEQPLHLCNARMEIEQKILYLFLTTPSPIGFPLV